jgi:uncharacterized membrane protein
MRTKNLFQRINSSQTSTIHDWLIASAIFSCMLLAGRMLATQTIEYIFLPWNLFLGFIPYWITRWMIKNEAALKNKITFGLVLAAWLLFIPNSFYIITDLVHFARVRTAPTWFDILLIFSFAWNGILFGITSFRYIEVIMIKIRGRNFSISFVFFVMLLNAFGIYIGRFLRYNSWDIISNPFDLAADIFNMVFHPFANEYAWGMTISYAIFMTFIYITIRKLGEAFFVIK